MVAPVLSHRQPEAGEFDVYVLLRGIDVAAPYDAPGGL